VSPKILFGLGVGFAVAGIALSLNAVAAVQAAGAVATLLAMVCIVWISLATRGVAVDSSASSGSRKRMGIAWAFVCIAAMMTLLVEFRWSQFGHQAAAVLLFMLCIMLLLQQRAQGKIT
jgi:hypothetical protein